MLKKMMMVLPSVFALIIAPMAMASDEVAAGNQEQVAANDAAANQAAPAHEAAVAAPAEQAKPNAGSAGWMAIATGIGLGLAAFGGALGQGRVASAALEGLARNPNAADKLQAPMILGLAFIESLVLFVWVVMFLIQNKF